MPLKPIFESEASNEVLKEYKRLKDALELPQIPLFFAYFGPFPEYLSYITNQLVSNLTHSQFENLSKESSTQVQKLTQDSLRKSPEVQNWLTLYRNSPSFYYFQKDLEKIFLVNIKLAFIFIALREAVKGWAIAAKKLTPNVDLQKQQIAKNLSEERFIFTQVSDFEGRVDANGLTTQKKDLAVPSPHFLEKDLLPEYLSLLRRDFIFLMKTDEFWILRVGIEKMILAGLTSFPELIFSPINVVLHLTTKNPSFPDFLYLLSEHFPTFAMQRAMFSGFMIE